MTNSLRKITALWVAMCFACAAFGQTESAMQRLNREGKEFLEKSMTDQAEARFRQAVEMQQGNGAVTVSAEYIESLSGLAAVSFMRQEFTKVDSLYARITRLTVQKYGDRSPQYAEVISNLGWNDIQRQKFDGAEPALKTALDIRSEVFGKQSAEYAETLFILGNLYTYTGKYNEAGSALAESAQIRLDIFGKNGIPYLDTQIARGTLSLFKQDYSAAEKYYSDVVETIDRQYGNSVRDLKGELLNCYVTGMGAMSTLFGYTGRYREAVDLLNKAIPLLKENFGETHPDYIACTSNLGTYYFKLGDYRNAESTLKESMRLSLQIFGEKHSHYFNALGVLATLYETKGQYEKAEPLFVRSLELRKELYGPVHPSIAVALLNLSNLSNSMGNYARSEEYIREAMDLTRSTLGEASADYANGLNALANAYILQQNDADALPLLKRAAQIQKNAAGELSPAYLAIQSNICSIMIRHLELYGQVGEAELLELLGKRRTLSGESSEEYIKTLNHLATFYDATGKHDKATECFDRCLSLLQSLGMNDSQLYLTILFNSGVNLELNSKIPEAAHRFGSYLDGAKDQIKRNFAFLSEKERELYWDSNNSNIKFIQGFACRHHGSHPSLGGLAYDCELFSKSLLLNSSNQVRQSILNSGDRELVSSWVQFINSAEQVEELRNAIRRMVPDASADQIAEQKNALEELEKAVERSEKELVVRSQAYRQQQMDFSMHWENIRDALKPHEAAVEFVVYHDISDANDIIDNLYYCALLINHSSQYPEIILLGDEATVQRGLQDPGTLYQLLWQPLNNGLMGASNIYVSSSGLLNLIPFAAIRTGSHYITEDCKIHNLLSTKDIITIKNTARTTKPKYAILFGGADFSLSGKDMARLDGDIEKSDLSNMTRSMLNAMDTLRRGQGFDYLPGSKREVLAVSDLLSENHWEVAVYVDRDATETRLRSYSKRQSPALLHISTHGFFFPKFTEPVAEVHSASYENNVFRISVNPLIRTGLLFSGANNLWTGKDPVEGTDDGILTGYEISMLNLSNTELVVLSACETGLGEINYSEGVYGLQRAFRLAGVRCMIVSLWKIPDKETVEFMTGFYRSYASGSGIKDSFDQAINTMKNLYPDDFEKWAGLVLIE